MVSFVKGQIPGSFPREAQDGPRSLGGLVVPDSRWQMAGSFLTTRSCFQGPAEGET